jgi:hypothetical protein
MQTAAWTCADRYTALTGTPLDALRLSPALQARHLAEPRPPKPPGLEQMLG